MIVQRIHPSASTRLLLSLTSSKFSPRQHPFIRPYSMSSLSADLTAPNGRSFTQPLGLFINNEFVQSSKDSTITSVDPSTENEIASVQAATAEDVDKAVQAARKALHDASWKLLPGTERGMLMSKLADLIDENRELLATIETWDNGKPYADALDGDVAECSAVIRYYGGYADKIHGQTIPTTPAKFAYTLRQPMGVVGQIIPWNYPLAMACWKLGPALACGNTVVLKAAEQTPLSVLMLGRLIKEAGFPPGVINLINGTGAEAGSALVSHPGVDKIAFTGSTATARRIMASAAGTLKNITLETGGKSPLLVFDDADLDQAVKWSQVGIFSNKGEICTATSRLLVQRGIYDRFTRAFIEATKSKVIGNPFDEGTMHGPQVSKGQYEQVLSFIEKGKSEGANLVAGGEPGSRTKGYFISPTVFTNVEEGMTIWREEIFGPVVVIAAFDTEEEAIQKANSTSYGLGAAIFTTNITRAHRVAAEIEAGTVWINSSQDSDFRIPFGGFKQSGIGRELGEAGLEAYSQIKAVHVNVGTTL